MVEIASELVDKFSSVINLLEALGVVVLIYIVFGVINFFIERRRMKAMEQISKDVSDIKKLMSRKSKK